MENETNKKKKGLFIFLIIIIIALIIAITLLVIDIVNNSDKKTDKSKEPIPMSAYAITGNSLDKFDLYFLALENEEKNKIYSPLSIKYALAMLKAGAKDDTKEQIESVIGEYEAKNYVNSNNMSFANALFIKDSYQDKINTSYIDTLTSKYNAQVVYDSFKTADTVNSWVSERTFKLINNLFDNVSAEDFILVNALAIDMEWKQKIQATEDNWEDSYGVFYMHEKFSHYIPMLYEDYSELIEFNGKEGIKALEIGAAINKYDIVNELGEENIRKTVGDAYNTFLAEGGCGDDPTIEEFLDNYIKEINSNYKQMDVSTDFLYYTDDDTTVFAKDLKEYDGTTLQYISIMPKKESLTKYIEDVTPEDINDLIKELKGVEYDNFKEGVITKITGFLPIFNYDYELNLIEDLKKLGITDVFDSDKANLDNLTSDKKAYINKAIHKANIEFSNDGIKAAAVTAAGGLGAGGCSFDYNYDVPVEIIDLSFNNPYLFIIRDKNSGEVWFTGTVYEPLSNN